MKEGLAYYAFTAGRSMPPNQAFYSADGDFLLGTLLDPLIGNALSQAS
jgi:hypothetical protein